MPLTDCPFVAYPDRTYRPWLQIRIINPHTGLSQRTLGLVDTGADECAVPAGFAELLGHNLMAGAARTISTGGGNALGYAHTTKFEVTWQWLPAEREGD